MGRTIFQPALLKIKFKNWNRLDLAKAAATVLDTVAYLHSMNILVGDINPANILVNRDRSVAFVDCDSFQVERFPCPVCIPTFLAPDLHEQDLRSTLRTVQQEMFAVSTLIFMILHPGKPPYSHEGGSDPAHNVRKRHFPYPLGDKKSEGVPEGPWRFMFSHLPRYLKDAFHSVFSDGESISVEEWQKFMKRYCSDLEKKYVSSKIFPVHFKRLSQQQAEYQGIPWRICQECGKGFASKDHDICPECGIPRDVERTQRPSGGPSPRSTVSRSTNAADRSVITRILSGLGWN